MQDEIKKLIAKGINGHLIGSEEEKLEQAYINLPKEQREQIQWILLKNELGSNAWSITQSIDASSNGSLFELREIVKTHEKTLKKLDIIIVLLAIFLIIFTIKIFQ